jgi:hypothetical protein
MSAEPVNRLLDGPSGILRRNGVAELREYLCPSCELHPIRTIAQVKEHRYLFVDGDVEGQLRPEIEIQRRIHTPRTLDGSTEQTLEWAVDIIIDELKKQRAT